MAAKQFAFMVFFAVVIAINAKPTNSDEGIFLTQVCYTVVPRSYATQCVELELRWQFCVHMS